MKSCFQELENLRALEHISQKQIDFFVELLKIKDTAKKLINNNWVLSQFKEEELKQRHKKGLPLIRFEDIRLNQNLLKDLFRDICALIKKHSPENATSVDSFLSLFEEGKLDLVEFIQDAATEEKVKIDYISQKTGIDKHTLIFIATYLAKPFFESVATALKDKINLEQWIKGYCPVCGSWPLMSKFRRDDGRRIFECSVCVTEWPFRRIRCPFCDNDDAESLRFFFIDSNSPYRVDVCDKCKRYIKTVDERKLPKNKEVVLVVEDLATSYLDILAEKEKFSSSHSDTKVTAVP